MSTGDPAKPCPFCAGENLIVVRSLLSTWKTKVRCQGCEAEGPACLDGTEGDEEARRIVGHNNAIISWNTRA